MHKILLLALTLTLPVLSGCTSMLVGSGGPSAGKPIGTDSRSSAEASQDARISTIIRNRFAADSGLAAARLQVVTSRRVVTLKGTVPDFEDRDRAERLARDVEGVVRVQNQVAVRSR
jgi:osmotically-inducible protein OsmY